MPSMHMFIVYLIRNTTLKMAIFDMQWCYKSLAEKLYLMHAADRLGQLHLRHRSNVHFIMLLDSS